MRPPGLLHVPLEVTQPPVRVQFMSSQVVRLDGAPAPAAHGAAAAAGTGWASRGGPRRRGGGRRGFLTVLEDHWPGGLERDAGRTVARSPATSAATVVPYGSGRRRGEDQDRVGLRPADGRRRRPCEPIADREGPGR